MPYDVFISYSHKDRKLRDELATHLSNLRRQGIISDWFDGDIIPGSKWQKTLMDTLKKAHIILLLVSADFIHSDFCYGDEMTLALARDKAGEACVLPIILRPVDWKGAPFADLQLLPSGAKPITLWPTHDEAFADVIAGIRTAIEDLEKKGVAPNP
jgi:hypothetical protein